MTGKPDNFQLFESGMILGITTVGSISAVLFYFGATTKTILLSLICGGVFGGLAAVLWRPISDRIYWWRFDRQTNRESSPRKAA